ncbi:MAG TPA: glycosyltransferase family 1 protein [Cellulomonas sp.]
MSHARAAVPPRPAGADRPLDVVMTTEQLWQPTPGGSGTYVRELAAALLRRDDIALTGLHARHAGPPDPSWSVPDGMGQIASRLPRQALYETWNRWRLPRSAGAADVVHATTWAVPPRSAPLVVTVHDLAFLRSPEHFTRRGAAFFTRALDVVRAQATRVLAVSGTTRDDCVAAGIDPTRIRVVPHGVRVPAVTGPDGLELRRRFGLTRPYLLWCGTVEPRKNVPGLLRAYAEAARRMPDLDLVLVGPDGWSGAPEEVTRALAALPADRVHRLGALSWADLHAAYAQARAFCYPSLWEGFGMPVLEAMSHGVPVVTSTGTSMAEVAGDAALLAPATDVDALADALVQATGDRHDELAAAAREHAAGYTWDRCAAATAEVYREAAAEVDRGPAGR